MSTTGFFTDEYCFWQSGAGQYALTLPVGKWVEPPAGAAHAESPESKRRFKNLVEVSGLAKRLSMSSATPISVEQMQRVHTTEYLERFRELSAQGGGKLTASAPVGPNTYEVARVAAGLATAAVSQVLAGELSNAYVLSRPPGHHCSADEAMGFCYLNYAAIAIEEARSRFGLKRIAVVDWDVHHGNGTQSIFYDRNDVLTISLHQQRTFPRGYTGEDDKGSGAGEGYNINIPLPPGSGHNTYIHALEKIVLPSLEQYQPELIIISCGYDASGVDPLSRMLLHSETYRAMTTMVKDAASRLCEGKLVMIHEGGYSEAYVPFCGLATIEALSGERTEVEDPMLAHVSAQQPDEETLEFQKAIIDRLAERVDIKGL